jgi:D-beta-D-heptose 7-phosphate kinase / D-beta-D-heptose 1-phosphate adenosyltransferase
VTVKVLVIGDVLLDRDIEGEVRRVSPDAPVPVVEVGEVAERAGGAGLAATLLARDGIDVHLVTALADDEPAKRLSAKLAERIRVTVVMSGPGTRCKTRIRSAGQAMLRLDVDPRADAFGNDERVDLGAVEEALAAADAVLVSDYAGGVITHPDVRKVLARWASRTAMVWDPHPLGAEPVPGVTLATPNRSEAVGFCGGTTTDLDRVAAELQNRWESWAVAVTDGGNGVFTATGGGPAHFTPAPFRYRGDCCGAGDRFAGTVTAELAAGVLAEDAVATAVADTAGWLATGGVSATGEQASDAVPDAMALVHRVRSSGGTVVATGGCFDVLHAGHVASLEAARRLGDALVVLVNSDDSVRRLKGPDRPVNGAEDRCQVLRSLRCVDAVAVFDGPDPCEALDQLRPDIWAKGGDYTLEMLPEAPLVRRWGGRVVLVPYLPGRSSSRILDHSTASSERSTR